jgi:citrate lyase subunit beta/citryl-CoA lyase
MTDLADEPCSMLFVPADAERFLAKAGQRGADALILDLEDGVAPSKKDLARAALTDATARLRPAGVPIWVRVNAVPDRLEADLRAAVVAGARGVLMPKVDSPADLHALDAMLDRVEAAAGRSPGTTRVMALLESPAALCDASAIGRASRRLDALVFGVEDFAATMGIATHPDAMTGPAQTVAIAAVAAGLQPIGLPGSVADFSDPAAYRRLVEHARRIGLRGSVCIHPAQVAIINEVFGGTDEEIAAARALLAAFEAALAAGRGAVAHEGRMVDEPIARRARVLVARHERIRTRRAAAAARGTPG